FWRQVKHELAAYVTNLDEPTANAWQVQTLYRERADAENVFDELKNQWGFNGFCARSRRVSAQVARLLVYNLWSLFVRLLEPARHVEAAGRRRWFLVIAARLVESGRQKTLQVSVQGRWWKPLKTGYTRVAQWLASTAPQLKIPPPPPRPTCLAPA
ncbi:MAG TPA: transposase, partial [Acidobacteriota bacterium]|nr:transposase [Acidobacteriota bacterium]